QDAAVEAREDVEEMGLINAFGMYWQRNAVSWKNRPVLLGYQQSGSRRVDFSEQGGVYLLHDATRVVYVGQAGDMRLGARLLEHTRDRLNGRWDRFSWFGVKGVSEEGGLTDPPAAFGMNTLISTMEAL